MIRYHLPGLFEFHDLYSKFLPIFFENRKYFYDWCSIGSIYGSPRDCLWGGGRIEDGEDKPLEILEFLNKYNISGRLTFSNSLIEEEHLSDRKCNKLCQLFNRQKNGIILYSDLLINYLKSKYDNFYYVSTTTKVLTDFNDFVDELNREEFSYVVPDFRLNKEFDKLRGLTDAQKEKVEFLCNECCDFNCAERKECYEAVSAKNIGIIRPEHICASKEGSLGYRFSKAMENEGFISTEDILNIYEPMGFTNFKIEGRGLGSAVVFEMLLYYMVKPSYHIHVREKVYLDNNLWLL